MLDALTQGDFTRLDKVLQSNAEDALMWMDYLAAKSTAEDEEWKFQDQLNAQKRRK